MDKIKCSRCYNNKYIHDFSVYCNGRPYKTCIMCNEAKKNAKKCHHGKRKNNCKDCGGGSVCEHNKIRSICKKCVGGSICEHLRERRKCKDCDFGGYLSDIVKSKVRYALKKEKNNRALKYIGCDIEELKKYIESKFNEENGFTWNNYAVLWEIDHIIPLKYNNPSTDEIIERLKYTNLQPLRKDDNIKKSNKFIG